MKYDFAAEACALVGTPFRPQGRDPAIGLDCVGLVLATFRIPFDSVRRDYRLRGNHRVEIESGIARFFRPVRPGEPGDLMLLMVGPDQLHLGVRTNLGFVHADARLGRAVETPGEPRWAVLGTFRKRRIERGI